VLKVNEIFYSIQGESSYWGFPCVFIRLTGCNLRCKYCDTKYAYKRGTKMTVNKIIDSVSKYDCPLVLITGGEPLLQEETPLLVQNLIDLRFKVLIETNGTQNINLIKSSAIRVVDIKTPGSGESDKTDWMNIKWLDERDQVKFVLTSRSDYDWSKQVILNYGLIDRVSVLFSPVFGILNPPDLARWILDDRLHVRLQLSLHKILWPDETSGK
jgi:7-carboxy-7-deazaguanine synthase